MEVATPYDETVMAKKALETEMRRPFRRRALIMKQYREANMRPRLASPSNEEAEAREKWARMAEK